MIFWMSTLLCWSLVKPGDSRYNPDLPDSHLKYLYNQFPSLAPPDFNFTADCWGFQNNCKQPFSYPRCEGNSTGWAKSREEAERMFFTEADFGYVKERRRELTEFCDKSSVVQNGHKKFHSSLRCSKNLQFCEGRNLILDFNSIKDRVRRENLRYKMDLLSPGDVRINCNFKQDEFSRQLEYMSPLQSWAPELRNIRESSEPLSDLTCDIIIHKPVIVMKLDAYVNMYHHFCDFVNLYLSLFVRPVKSGDRMFDVKNQVIIWENYKYMSNFAPVWEAFTDSPLLNLNDLAGKRVCMKKVTFPLLPRMMYGLYYNTPLIPGCQDSGVFRAFSQFILHRLRIPVRERTDEKLRVTVLLRGTRYRSVLNQDQLVQALHTSYHVQTARFDHRTDFKKQLDIIRNSDMLIGIHGAGLTHMLFLPDWGGVLELYNCNDPACYSDLARLRGLKYLTWEDTSLLTAEEADPGQPYSGPAHEKFMNYKFDVDELLRLVRKLEKKIRADARFQEQSDLSGARFQEQSDLSGARFQEQSDRTGDTAASSTKDKDEF